MMTTQQTMAVIYPALAAVSLITVFALLMIYLFGSGLRVNLAAAVYFTFEFVTFAILSITTGSDPIVDFNLWRPWLVGARVAMLPALLWFLFELVRRVWHHS